MTWPPLRRQYTTHGHAMDNPRLHVIHTTAFGLTPEGGNPCPIVFGGEQLSDAQMQTLAAGFGAETAFVLPSDRGECALRLRYFVPQHEMEMCGHATVATVAVLAAQGRFDAPSISVETPLGPLAVSWERDARGVRVTVEQFPPRFGGEGVAADVAGVLGLPETALARKLGPIQSVSVSRAKLMVPIRERPDLDALRPDFERLWALCDTYDTTGFYPFATDSGRIWARQFPKRAGYNEDPATGVAACALGAYLVEHAVFGEKTEGWHNLDIEQGHAMGRPSLIEVGVRVEQGQVVCTRMSGRAMILREEERSLAAD